MRTTLRQWHSYIGLFIAPSVLFFALSGAAQLYNLHEAHGHYQPAAIVEKLSSVHKDQVFALGDHHPKEDAGSAPPPDSKDDDDKTAMPTLVLKGFFLVVSSCLIVSTSLGLWMGLTQTRRKGLAWSLFVAGALVPMGLLIF